ncbi:hypothetical protein RND71_036652 [Anisodus tanguticus]|uniref:Uncharacterized protein n=1 Tax=Anisodus tanguticus TaxID=243964 RepID=A0AAE1R1W5_9SOLA|nr:hypothetical protein RND71_036652 [Anisodus tanguticus]
MKKEKEEKQSVLDIIYMYRTASKVIRCWANNAADQLEDDIDDINLDSWRKEQGTKNDDHLTPAERKYLKQWEKINIKRPPR